MDLIEDDTMSYDSYSGSEPRTNSSSCYPKIQNNSINDDENEIEVSESIDDEATTFSSTCIVFLIWYQIDNTIN